MDKFSYQNEWRIVLYRGAKTYEPYRLEIGNIRDICHWVKAEDLDTELRIYFHNNKIKSPYLVEYGNCTKDELRNLFCKLDRMRGEEVDLFTKRSKLKSNVAQTTRTNNQSYVKCQGTPSRRMWSFLFMVEK